MNYLFPIINFIFAFGLFCLSFEIHKKTKAVLYCLSTFFLTLLVLCLFLNQTLILPLFGMQWNVLLPCLITLELALMIPVCHKKKYAGISTIFPFLVDILAKVVVSIVFDIPFNELNRSEYFYFTFYLYMVVFILYIIAYFVFKVATNPNRYEENKSFFAILFILAGVELLAFFIINYNLSKIMTITPSSYIYTILFNLLLILLFGITIISSIILHKKIKEKYKKINQMKEELLDKNYQDIYIETQEELFKLRHDMANMIETIHTYDNPEIQSVKEDLSNKLREQKFFYTKNKIINSILTNKIRIAKEKKIQVDTEISVDRDLLISNIDLISLLSNLLDNSIEALEKEIDKKLILDIGSTENTLEISIQNSCQIVQKTKKENPQYHGFGLKIIKEIVSKYKGSYTSFLEDGMYTTMIVIEC